MAGRRTRKLMKEGGGTVDWLPEWQPVHPDANAFPMMDDDGMAGLRASILENGQEEPIRQTEEGELLDGRNRYRACMLERIEPSFITIRDNGKPWAERIRAWNLTRRHLTASQRAANIRLGSRAKLTQEQVAIKAGCSQPQVARVDAGAEFLHAEGTAKTLSAAYSMIVYGQITEGQLRKRKAEAVKESKVSDAAKTAADRLDRASREIQRAIDSTPADEREAFVDGMRSASSIVSRFNVGGLDLEKMIGWATLEDLDEDEQAEAVEKLVQGA